MASVSFTPVDRLDTPSFNSFISLWTLSLAPLIVHVMAGVPQRVYLTQRRPTLLQQIVHWNPTSILWRYFAITDRRIRAKAWDKATLATANALFWTEHGWDGSEDRLDVHRSFLMRAPRKTHVELLSASFPKTVVVALQGGQALYQLVAYQTFAQNTAAILPMIFLPLALFGLFRLPAAYWLSEEYTFADVRDDADSQRSALDRPSLQHRSSSSSPLLTRDRTFSTGSELEPIASASTAYQESLYSNPTVPASQYQPLRKFSNVTDQSSETQYFKATHRPMMDLNTEFYPPSNWRGILVRLLFQISTLGIVALSIIYLTMAGDKKESLTVVGLLMIVSYATFTIITALLFITNIVSGGSHTTVIPGIDTFWYKAYTCILFAMALTMFIFASLEQIQPPCDGAGGCEGLLQLRAFNITLASAGTPTEGSWNMSGHLYAESIYISGKYNGFLAGVDEDGTRFNVSLPW